MTIKWRGVSNKRNIDREKTKSHTENQTDYNAGYSYKGHVFRMIGAYGLE
jgi:hypothetical protein